MILQKGIDNEMVAVTMCFDEKLLKHDAEMSTYTPFLELVFVTWNAMCFNAFSISSDSERSYNAQSLLGVNLGTGTQLAYHVVSTVPSSLHHRVGCNLKTSPNICHIIEQDKLEGFNLSEF